MGQVHVVGYFSIDRIEAAGTSRDDVPGGAALYAALAARGAGGDVALHAVAGSDFRPEWLRRLADLGIDLQAVAQDAGPTRRARLSYLTPDARRSAHHAEAAWWERTLTLAPTPPDRTNRDAVLALTAAPHAVADAALAVARRCGARIVLDTSAAFVARERDALLARVGKVQVFAPSLEETRLLFPGLPDDDAAARLADLGCDVLHKRGSAGAYALQAGGIRGERIDAPPAQLRDPTGAGDATLGALAAELAAGRSFIDAARAALGWGARCVGGLGPAALGLDFEMAETA